MSFLDNFIAACVVINLCSGDEPPEVNLPEDDGSIFVYDAPVVVIPEVTPEEPVMPDFAPLVIEKTVYIELPAPAPEPESQDSRPEANPQLVAYYELLTLRREDAALHGLSSGSYSAAYTNNRTGNAGLSEDMDTLEQLNVPSLDFAFATQNSQLKRTDDRYSRPGYDSGLPVDNSRIVRSDRYISAVFEGGVNSQLATGGEVVLQVTQHVFSLHGRNVLIPKGSRLECTYEVPMHANSTRLEFVCDRILLAENEAEIYQINSRLYDVHGNLGVSGHVDRRFWDRYGEAIIVTGISAATRIAAGLIDSEDNQNIASSVNAGAEDLSQRFGEITASILEEKLNTKPIIRIAQGTPVIIKPSNDWYISSFGKT